MKFSIFLLVFFAVCFAGTFPARAEVATYKGLVQAIRVVRSETQARIDQTIRQERVREAWEIGKLIDEHVLQNKERADYGKQVIEKLAVDLGIGRTELYYMLEFARTYSNVHVRGHLTWSHYKVLLAVNDPEEREKFAKLAESNNWSQKELQREIKRQRLLRPSGARNDGDEEVFESLQPGELYTYRVVRPEKGPLKGRLALDLGFSSYHVPGEDLKEFEEGDMVMMAPGESTAQPGTEDDLHTYVIDVIEVLDGDTLKAVVDLGFDFTTVQKLRLRGIDAPEIESPDGREAKAFLETQLENQPEILVRTAKSDKYDRYLADVFVKKNGRWESVNRLLVEERLAIPVSE